MMFEWLRSRSGAGRHGKRPEEERAQLQQDRLKKAEKDARGQHRGPSRAEKKAVAAAAASPLVLEVANTFESRPAIANALRVTAQGMAAAPAALQLRSQQPDRNQAADAAARRYELQKTLQAGRDGREQSQEQRRERDR